MTRPGGAKSKETNTFSTSPFQGHVAVETDLKSKLTMKSVLITGANRGIGLGLIKRIVSDYSNVELIFAGYRDASRSQELLDFAKQHSKVVVPLQIDVSDDDSVSKAKTEVEQKLGGNKGLNCLINNAGVSKNVTLDQINEQDMLDTYKHNVVGPWRVTKLEKAVSGDRNVLQASIINVSTIMSSNAIASNLPHFAFDYQCSKAALNMYTVCFAALMAKSNVFIVLLHPGWVQTDMGGTDAPLNIEQATKNIMESITAMKDEHYGKLIDSDSGSQCKVIPF